MARAKTSGNGAARRKQAEASPAVIPVETALNPYPANLVEEIRTRAYQLSERRGFTPGHEREDWLAAEREILAERGMLTRAHHA